MEVEEIFFKKYYSESQAFRKKVFELPVFSKTEKRGIRSVIKLKEFNRFIAYEHFMSEWLHSLKSILQKGDFMCKMDLKDAYFVIPPSESSKKFVRLEWKGSFGLMKVTLSLQCCTMFS